MIITGEPMARFYNAVNFVELMHNIGYNEIDNN